jgi:hypothetical protein
VEFLHKKPLPNNNDQGEAVIKNLTGVGISSLPAILVLV